ncbi:hypothetical protein PR048_002646 [Dryococelus australis]|uniref:Uncharacterized protein n=1 Tax=Dryococelus australis TaxID=614101 RepID=A0ABQ9IKS6_9NEOP|nr:hypothetical protein PR048_002646 [Dryococelus australis]
MEQCRNARVGKLQITDEQYRLTRFPLENIREAPRHFAMSVHRHLNMHVPNRWIERGSPIAWPPRSHDITPPDFWLWGVPCARVQTQGYTKTLTFEMFPQHKHKSSK